MAVAAVAALVGLELLARVRDRRARADGRDGVPARAGGAAAEAGADAGRADGGERRREHDRERRHVRRARRSAGSCSRSSSPGWVFAVHRALTFVWSALLIVADRPRRAAAARAPATAGEGAWTTASAGFRAIGGQPHVRLIVILYSLQTVIAGAVGVLVVVAAFDLLDLGNARHRLPQLGGRASAGSSAPSSCSRSPARGRLAGDFGVGVALFGLPLVLIAVWPTPATALVALGLLGLGNTITDVNALTLLQRNVARRRARARVRRARERARRHDRPRRDARAARDRADRDPAGAARLRPAPADRRRGALAAAAARSTAETHGAGAAARAAARDPDLRAAAAADARGARAPARAGRGRRRRDRLPRRRPRRPLLHRRRRARPRSSSTTPSGRSGPATRSARSRCCTTCRGLRPFAR